MATKQLLHDAEEKAWERQRQFYARKLTETGDKKWCWIAEQNGFDVDWSLSDYKMDKFNN